MNAVVRTGFQWRGAVRLALLMVPYLVPFPPPALLGQARFTLEEILSAPFPEGLVSHPGAGWVSWVQNDEGVRNIWVASSPEYQGRQVTGYREDDGQALSNLIISRELRQVVFIRGGGPNTRGEIPNPVSDPSGTSRAIWTVSLDGGEPRMLAEGSSPALAPGGSLLAYVGSGNTIWTVDLDEEATPTQVAKIRGGAGSLAWSPDGSQLAFTSGRGNHSFVGVLDLAAETIGYLDPSFTLDQSPVWSPDGRHLAFIRAPFPRGFLPFTPAREGLPWSIRVVEMASGRVWTAFSASEGPGSVFGTVSSEKQLWWAHDDRLVFPWERDGWTHLYSVPATGGDPLLLTPGPFEVQYVAMSFDQRQVLYSSNQDDIDRQHLWRVPVSGGPAVLLTPGDGIEWSPVPADETGSVAFLGSGGTEPARAKIHLDEGETRDLAPDALFSDFPQEHLVQPEQVVFSGADGLRIHGQLFRPRDAREGERYPAMLFFHGGSRRQMLLGFHHRGYYHNTYAFNQFLADQGFLVLSVNYRSGIGYGMEFREALNYGAQGASEFNDVLGAGLYLRGRPDVDPDRIGLWGGSYGGYLTALGLARASDLFAAGVDLHGVHDWNVVIRNFVPSYDATALRAFAELALRSSPMADLDTWRSPVLLIHGDDDRNVPFSESVDLSLELRRRGVEVEELVFPDEVHGFLLHRNWLAAFRTATEFLRRRLGTAGG